MPAMIGRDTSWRILLWALALLWAASAPVTVQAKDAVALELVLAVDTSASVDNAEFRLQMGGIANGFRHPDVIAAIKAQGALGIAVTLVQWSAGDQQVQSVGWHRLYDRGSALAFANAVDRAPRMFAVNTTAIGSALRFSAALFWSSPYAGERRSIDVSGDGNSNAGLIAAKERDRVVAAGITINGLAILNGHIKLDRYYRINVIGGPGSFVLVAEDFSDFARAMREKLMREISPAIALRSVPARIMLASRHHPR